MDPKVAASLKNKTKSINFESNTINISRQGYPSICSSISHSITFKTNKGWSRIDHDRNEIKNLDKEKPLFVFLSNSKTIYLKDKRNASLDTLTITTSSDINFVQAGGTQCWLMTTNNDVYLLGNQESCESIGNDGKLRKEEIPLFDNHTELPTIVSIGTGFYYSMFLFKGGTVLGVGQENSERNEPLSNGWRKIKAPKMKTISCGSNQTLGVSFEEELVMWGSGAANYTTNGENPGVINIDPMVKYKWYNAACGGFYSVAISDQGVFWFGDEEQPEVVTKSKNYKAEANAFKQHVYKISNILPKDIERLYTTYNACFIIPKEGDWTIAYHNGEFTSYQAVELILDHCGNSSLLIPLSGNSLFEMNWTKENHYQWPGKFRKTSYYVLLAFKRLNIENHFSYLIPKVIVLEFIKFLSFSAFL
eukprot:TRINITY_DN106_c0_g1_i1.p1 TRINITY_DN106_c0_g1~~TRINITY_DN106_c0_g1_i1.p1  ORF type:complete len:420 (+),score=81.90 TRINITY_DN106_c0_g1_i1:21-1280(+)